MRTLLAVLVDPKQQQCFVEARGSLEKTRFAHWGSTILSQGQALEDSLADGHTAADHVGRLESQNIKLSKPFLTAMLRDGNSSVEAALKYFHCKPNATQLAVAVYAVGLLEKNAHQLWQLPAGTGKSRVIAAAALVWAKTNREGLVHIVIPHELLCKRDTATFADLWKLGDVENRVRYQRSPPMDAARDDLVIMDEADLLIFNHTDAVKTVLAKHMVLAFTATIS